VTPTDQHEGILFARRRRPQATDEMIVWRRERIKTARRTLGHSEAALGKQGENAGREHGTRRN
jgi:hypothetical protein